VGSGGLGDGDGDGEAEGLDLPDVVSYDGQAQARASLVFTDPGRPAINTIDLQETRKTITTKDKDRSEE
jgi:hypothetical protein